MIILSPSPCLTIFSSTARMKTQETHRRLLLGPTRWTALRTGPRQLESTGPMTLQPRPVSHVRQRSSREAHLPRKSGTPLAPGGTSFCPLFPLLMTKCVSSPRCSHWLAPHSFSGEKFVVRRASHHPWDDGSDGTLRELRHQICSCRGHFVHLAL